MIYLFTDGASRGNGGESAAAYIICNGKEEIHSNVRHIGLTTNNMAEYMAVHDAIEHCYLNPDTIVDKEFTVISDSLLVINQLKGEWQIKNKDLYIINKQIKFFIEHMNDVKFEFKWKPREYFMLKRCDKMNNDCLNALT